MANGVSKLIIRELGTEFSKETLEEHFNKKYIGGIKIENFKKVDAPIIDVDGNIYNLIGICQRELKRNGYRDKAHELASRVTSSHSYDEALQIILEYVNPVSQYDMEENYFEI